MAGAKSSIFTGLVVIVLVLGVLDVIINKEENKCEMTWMYEQPEYLKVHLPRLLIKKFPNYGLYVYGEGTYARILSSMKMTGIPVLFIPGNAGSYKQVRSLASVAFRRAIAKQKRYNFDFFTVDLNEEFSGIIGAPLKQQTEFVHGAIKRIFTLYKHAEIKPSTIILVGHSMGGLIARGLFTLPDFDAKLVNTIFMQATPNQSPVLMLDGAMMEYYESVNTYWKDHGNSTLDHVTLVSSGGGEYDIQVRGGLTVLDGIVDKNHSISTSTIHIPKAWVSTDHRCIVWCLQVVKRFVRAMFDIVDEDTKKVRDDVEFRMSVFRYNFLQNAGSIGHVKPWPTEITLNSEIPWTKMSQQVWKWQQNQVMSETYLAMSVADFEEVDEAVVMSNIPQDSWICVCELKQGEKQCTRCTDVSSTGNLVPPIKSKKKVVHINLNADNMSHVTHVVVVVPQTDKPVAVTGEFLKEDMKHLSNSVPGVMEIMMSYPESVTKGAMVLDLGRGSSFYKLKLYNLNNVLKVYNARLETSKCDSQNQAEHAGSVLRFRVPWSNEDTYQYSKYGSNGSITLKVQFVPPEPVLSPETMDFQFAPPGETYDSVELYIYLDPSCSYKLRLTASFKEMLGQFVRFYGILMPVFCVATLLMTLVHQLRTLAKDGVCPGVLDSIWQVKPFQVVPFALLTQFLLQTKILRGYLENLPLPSPDILALEKQGIAFRGAQPLLFVTALGVTTFQATVISLIIQIKGRLAGLVLGWLPSRVMRLAQYVAVLVCVAGAGLAAVMCGSIGLFVSYVIGLLQILRLAYLTRQVNDQAIRSRYNFFMTLFMLWIWLLALNSPPLIVWAKTIKQSDWQTIPFLNEDPSKIVGTVAAVTFLCLLLCKTPLSGRSAFRAVAMVIHVMVVQMLVFGMVTIYRISYVVVASLVLIAVVEVLSEVKSKFTPKPKTE